MRIDQSVDELMWLVAEQGDPSAIEAFGKRYPEHRTELIKRISMVRELKQAGATAHAQVNAPAFRIKPAVRPMRPRWVTPALASLGLLCVGAASYFAFRGSPEATEPEVPAITGESAGDASGGNVIQPVRPRSGTNQTTPPTPPAKPITAYERPVTLDIEKGSLIEVLSQISLQSGLKIEMGPGMPNPEVVVQYQKKPAFELLQELGQTFGFTPFDQGNDNVLIIPAVDRTESQ